MHIGINSHLLSFSESYRQAGLSRYIDEIVRNVPACMPRARFTAFVGNQPVPEQYAKSARNLRFIRSRLPTHRAPVRILWEQTALPVATIRERLDLLHCPVSVRPVLSGCPVVITIHDLIFIKYPERFHPAKRLYLDHMTRWSARHAAHLIAVSDTTRNDIIELLGVQPAKVTRVYNGVGTQFTPLHRETVDAFKRQQKIEGRMVLYIGTLEPRKNLPVLLEAFAGLSSDPGLANVTLVIGGSKGWYYEEIFTTAERLGLTSAGRVRFTGRVPDADLPLWYNCADVFAYPSLYEGFGLPALEAMACGTPVVVSAASSLPEVVGNAGVLVRPEVPKDWAAAISRLLANSEEATELGRRGHERSKRFSWRAAAEETAAVYERVLSASR